MLWMGCVAGATSSRVVAPENMPDICQDIDFNAADAGLKKECGVQDRNYRAYRNIPEHRNLLLPKNSKVVVKNEKVELRLEGFMPIGLPAFFEDRIEFGETHRRQLLKSRFDYFEYFAPGAERPEKVFKLTIPLKGDTSGDVCYFVENQRLSSQRKSGYASRLLPLDCREFDKRKAEFAVESASTQTDSAKSLSAE